MAQAIVATDWPHRLAKLDRIRRAAVAALMLALIAAPVAVSGNGSAERSVKNPISALAERERAADTSSRSAERTEPALPATPEPSPEPVMMALAPTPSPKPSPTPSPSERPSETPSPKPTPTKPTPTKPTPTKPAPIGGLDQSQMDHAATIVRVGRDMGLPERAYIVAIATALQETYLRNLANPAYPESYNYPNDGSGYDHDSVGLFQQRASMGWGTVSQLMDPAYAARAFYDVLRNVYGWESMPITVAAQTVQVSAFPDHYAKHEPLARQLVDALA